MSTHTGQATGQANAGKNGGQSSPMQAFATGKPAVMHDATLERRWGEIALVFSRSRSARG
jgi:hypothetical protein